MDRRLDFLKTKLEEAMKVVEGSFSGVCIGEIGGGLDFCYKSIIFFILHATFSWCTINGDDPMELFCNWIHQLILASKIFLSNNYKNYVQIGVIVLIVSGMNSLISLCFSTI